MSIGFGKVDYLNNGKFGGIGVFEVTVSDRQDVVKVRSVSNCTLVGSGKFHVPALLAQMLQLRNLMDGYSWTDSAIKKVEVIKRERANQVEAIDRTIGNVLDGYKGESTPFDFQKRGANRLYVAGSGLLNDSTGLGKTCTSIITTRWDWENTLALEVAPPKGIVVCRGYKVWDWIREFSTWWPELRVTAVLGSAAKRRKILAGGSNVYVISYQNLVRHIQFPGNSKASSDDMVGPYDFAIVDEVHAICDPNTDQTKAVWALGKRSKSRLGLTATPVRNTVKDLFGVYHYLWPDEFSEYRTFRERYTIYRPGAFGGMEYIGFRPDTAKELAQIVRHRVVARDWTDPQVVAELPDVPMMPSPQFVSLPMTTQQVEQYKDLVNHLVTVDDSGELISARSGAHNFQLLSQAACGVLKLKSQVSDEPNQIDLLSLDLTDLTSKVSPYKLTEPSNKVAWLKELREGIEGGLLIYVVNRAVGELICRALECPFINGDVGNQIVDSLVQAYQSGRVRTLVASFDKFSEGVTLTNTEALVFAQVPTKNVQYQQAMGRVRRIGSTLPVDFYILQSEDSVDQHYYSLIQGKAAALWDALSVGKGRRGLLAQLMQGKEMSALAEGVSEDMDFIPGVGLVAWD